MARQFVGNTANLYTMPVTVGEGEAARQVYEPMAEMALLTMEPDYQLDDKRRIVKCTKLYTMRLHISRDNLVKYIAALGELQEQLDAFALQDAQQRAGVDPAQMSLPGI